MTTLNRRRAFAAAMLPLLVLVMAERARAAILTVSNLNDSGTGSLRGQIAAASAGDTIDFSVSGSIFLMSTLTVPKSLTIIGPSTSPGIALDGQDAVEVMNIALGTVVNLQNLTITNGSTDSDGGGILNNGSLTVTNCTFVGNRGESGGAILNGSTLMVSNSTFSSNLADAAGGGIYNDSGTVTVINSTFAGNAAVVFGGGISNSQTLSVSNSTFSGNISGITSGSAILNEGIASLKGTILAGSSQGNCNSASTPPVTDEGYNISDDDTCGFSGTSVNDSTTLNLDPAGLQNNGGLTQTIALEPNSQAIGFDKNCTDQAPSPNTILTDQRSFPRPNSPAECDAGAFELQTNRLAVLPAGERVQIARGATPNTDLVNMAFSFIDFGSPSVVEPTAVATPLKSSAAPNCDAGTDALNGASVELFAGTCDDLGSGGLLLDLAPWVVHTVAHVNYGTIFQSSPTVRSPETVSATILQQEPPEDSCGQWSLNIEVAGLDTAALNLGGTNPFALVVEDADKNVGCFDVTNAIVGSQIDPPKRTVRRAVRR